MFLLISIFEQINNKNRPMSFKIFSLQLLGKIKPVEKIEMQRELLYNDYTEFNKVADSKELSDFIELKKFIESDEFKKRKAEIQALHFKNSKEQNQLHEYEKLKNSKSFKNYFYVKDSEDFRRFQSLKESDKIKEYRLLLDFIEKGEYKKEKDEVALEVFRNSTEQRKLKEYNKLQKLPGIKAYFELHGSKQLDQHNSFYESEKLKRYFELKNLPDSEKQKHEEIKKLKKDSEIKSYLKFEHSKKLKLYHETADSYNLKRLYELKKEVESDAFQKRVEYLKDKKKFEKTEAYKKYKRFKELAADSDVKFFLKFEKSAALKNYYDVRDSMDLKRFLELDAVVTSEEFKERKAYLEDDKKWEKTDDFAKEQQYLEMKKMPHLVKYFKYKDSDAFSFFKEWEVSFEDNFTSGKLDEQKWSVKSLWAEGLPGGNYSMPGDLQVFTEGKNVEVSNKLVIETRREKSDGLVWQMPAGFVPTEFDFTSGIVSSGKSFWQEDGIFEAKIKFNPVKEVVSSFLLQGKKSSPRINLLEMGTKNRLGIASSSENGKINVEGIDISNLKKNKWYIFTIVKSGSTLTWKINDTEVLQMNNSLVNFKMHINMFSLVVFDVPGSKLPVRFETDWVKCYRKK